MIPVLALWAVPRSTSTAFEWMMRMRGDMQCWHEPFGEVWYQGEEPDWPRVQPDSVRTPGLTYASRWGELLDDARRHRVFIKDFPHYIEAMHGGPTIDPGFLDHFTHSFLIRDPARTVTSMFKHFPDFDIRECGFAEQRRLFDLLTEHLGSPPPVIDSDDLLADPPGIVRAWSEAVGIPWMPESLAWEPGPRDEVSWWDGGSFHENLRNSSGLTAQPRTSVDIAEAPARVQDVYAELLPHYEHLYAHRLGAA